MNFSGFLLDQVPDYWNFSINQSFRFYKWAGVQVSISFWWKDPPAICGANRCGCNVTINYNYSL